MGISTFIFEQISSQSHHKIV